MERRGKKVLFSPDRKERPADRPYSIHESLSRSRAELGVGFQVFSRRGGIEGVTLSAAAPSDGDTPWLWLPSLFPFFLIARVRNEKEWNSDFGGASVHR